MGKICIYYSFSVYASHSVCIWFHITMATPAHAAALLKGDLEEKG